MTSRDFCYWLQGYFEIFAKAELRNNVLTEAQVDIIKNHLKLVFIHEIDPEHAQTVSPQVAQSVHDGNGVAFRC